MEVHFIVPSWVWPALIGFVVGSITGGIVVAVKYVGPGWY